LSYFIFAIIDARPSFAMRVGALVPALGRQISAAATGKENVGQTSGDEKAAPWHISCPYQHKPREFRRRFS
jgi:hypothetical protein